MTTATPVLEICNLSLHRQGNCILNDVNIRVLPGELHSIIGPNGAGKTTLIHCLLGGLPHTGQIRFRFRKRGVIGYVPQHLEFDRAAPMTVRDFLRLLLEKSAIPFRRGRKRTQQIVELLALTQVDHLLERKLGSLSGGELQRVLLAQALHPQPEVLLLDEPASHVDEKGARQFERLLQRICQEQGITVIMVSHHLASILRISDNISVLNRDLVFTGDPWRFASSDTCYRLFGHRLDGNSNMDSNHKLQPLVGACEGYGS
jgi:zinc transport system ATP-binding protein